MCVFGVKMHILVCVCVHTCVYGGYVCVHACVCLVKECVCMCEFGVCVQDVHVWYLCVCLYVVSFLEILVCM